MSSLVACVFPGERISAPGGAGIAREVSMLLAALINDQLLGKDAHGMRILGAGWMKAGVIALCLG